VQNANCFHERQRNGLVWTLLLFIFFKQLAVGRHWRAGQVQ